MTTAGAFHVDIGFMTDGAYSLKEYLLIHELANDTSLKFSTAINVNTQDPIESLVDSAEWELRWWGQDTDDSNTLWVRDGAVLVCNSYHSSQTVYVKSYARSLDDAKAIVNQVNSKANPVEIVHDGTVRVNFWSVGDRGAESITRQIEAEDWAEVEENYTKTARTGIERLMTMTPPFEGGRIVLWHGPPGTGKSHAIRALVKQWEPWCDANYIVDPEVVFARAATLMDLLLGHHGYGRVKAGTWPDDTFVLHGQDRWRLFIMEDTDEFLQADAKERRGQAMSRLLNTADGFIGQGLKVLFLITTNEPMHKLHAAVSRPGRCIANTEVGLFTEEESRRWLSGRGLNPLDVPGIHNGLTLADCFDAMRQNKQIKREDLPTQQIGQYL